LAQPEQYYGLGTNLLYHDDFGLLRFVLQPELVSQLLQNATWLDPIAANLGNFAFLYKYDGRKRM